MSDNASNGWKFALSLCARTHPNDRMFFDTVDQVADAIRWALSNSGLGDELVLTVARPSS